MADSNTVDKAEVEEFLEFKRFKAELAQKQQEAPPEPRAAVVPAAAQPLEPVQTRDPNAERFGVGVQFMDSRPNMEREAREWDAAGDRFGAGLREARIMRSTIGAQMGRGDSSPEGVCRWLSDVIRDKGTARHLELILERGNASSQIPEMGGFLVPMQSSNNVTEFLRPFLWLTKVGARVIGSKSGNLFWPYQKTGSSASYGNENKAVAKQDVATWGEASWQVKRLGSLLVWPRELIAEASFDVDAMFRDDAGRAMAQTMNQKALYGTGQNSEPLGLANVTGLTTVTLNALPNENNILNFEDKLMDAYIDVDTMVSPGWVMNNKASKALKQVNATDEGMIFRKEMRDKKTLEGHPFAVTQLITTGSGSGKPTTVYFGDWAEYLIVRRGQLEIAASEHAAYESGNSAKSTFQRNQVAVRFLDYHDMGPRRKEAIAKCVDFKTE